MTFRWQTEACEHCDDGWQCSDAYGDRRCEECNGTGEQPRLCECGENAPLNDDGLCKSCAEDMLTTCVGDPFRKRDAA